MDEGQRPVLVLGHHRSGTTWVGSILGAATGHVALPGELSNPSSGYRLGGQRLSPYVTPDRLDRPRTDAALDRLARRPHRSLFSRRGLGGWVVPRRWHRVPVFKDPLGARIAGYLADALDARVVVVVRHPAATWMSLRRVGWDETLPDREVIGDAGGAGDELARFGDLWSTVYGELTAEATHRGWPVVRHEDLALDPTGAYAQLCARLGVPFDDQLQAQLRRTTGGAQTTPSDQVVHQLERDSAAVVDAWRDRIGSDELARVETVTAPVASRWYR